MLQCCGFGKLMYWSRLLINMRIFGQTKNHHLLEFLRFFLTSRSDEAWCLINRSINQWINFWCFTLFVFFLTFRVENELDKAHIKILSDKISMNLRSLETITLLLIYSVLYLDSDQEVSLYISIKITMSSGNNSHLF